MRWLRGLLLALAVMVTVTASSPVAAKDNDEELAEKKKRLPQRKAIFKQYKGWATMTVAWRDVINEKIRKKLMSGLPTTIATRAYVFDDTDSKEPVALSAKTCRVVYDLWDEVFRIEQRQAGRKRNTVAVNLEGVMRRCTEARRLALEQVKGLDEKKPYFVGVLVEVNPLSKEMLERIKRWVSRPNGAGKVERGDSLFGSFVGLFVTKVPEALQVLMFRTQTFVPSKLPVIEDEKKKKGKKSRS